MKRGCYQASVATFQKVAEDAWLKEMQQFFQEIYAGYPLSKEQIAAWRDCFCVMQRALAEAEQPETNYIVFEYMLPYEGGRRPDVLIISKTTVLVLEFKMMAGYNQAHLDQVLGYVRDLQEYHVESRNMKVIPLLVITGAQDVSHVTPGKGVFVRSGDRLHIKCQSREPFDLEQWLQSDYAPLPTVIDAARRFAHHEPLPQIRQVQSTGIDDAIACLQSVTEKTQREKQHILALVTGVPGAGKTFLGLKFVYDQEQVPAVFLSGNGPLIQVLEASLHSKLVRPIFNILDEYRHSGAMDFKNNIVVFDEGQRAWDQQQMQKKGRGQETEPAMLCRMLQERLDWCVLLVLVGEGQEIYSGEHGGIVQWREAITAGGWQVLCPSKLDEVFVGTAMLGDDRRQYLDLTCSLRAHLAGDVSTFVNAVIAGDVNTAQRLSSGLYQQKFALYLTRDLTKAMSYCHQRYEGEDDKHYGLLTSSRAQIMDDVLAKHGVKGEVPKTEYGKWYIKNRGEPYSSENFDYVVTEFGCQGLELDMPVVCWGKDMLWQNGRWKTNADYNEERRDYRVNSYRVLLSRGRDGCIVFMPQEAQYQTTYEMLKTVGINDLE